MAIFNNLIDFVAGVLAALYALPVVGGNYGFAIIMLTAGVMVILMPLTLKATRSTIKMQAVQPQLRKIQKEHKGDRETMNAELMALYQAEGINPVGGCIPMFAQLPFFLVLFRVLHGITRRTQDAPFFSVLNDVRAAKGLPLDLGQTITPSHIGHETRLYQDLIKDDKMHFGPLDLADKAADVIRSNFWHGLPYIVLIIFVVGTSYYQQRQVSARRKTDDNADASPMTQQQQMLLKFLPLMSGIWSFFFPAGLVLYWATSNVLRIGQQSYITHQIYGKEMAEGGRLATAGKKATLAEEAKPVKKPEPRSSEPSDPDPEPSVAAATSGTTRSQRQAEWERRRRAATAKSKKATAVSERVTPKGTQPRNGAAKKNRKR